MSSPFKPGSQPDKLNKHFKAGKSLTHDEAVTIGIGRLAQRMQDLKNKYLDRANFNPIRVYDEPNGRGGFHSRYFYAGAGWPLEANSKIRVY